MHKQRFKGLADSRNYRSEDRRGGIYGSQGFSDRTYDPVRYRDHDHEVEDRFRDRNRSEPHGTARGGRDYGYGGYGQSSGFRSGAEYGGFGRGTDFGSFNLGADLVYGSYWGRNESSRLKDHAGRGPKGYKRSNERIHDEICEILERHPLVDATDIEVEVKDGLVTLKGSVNDRNQKRFAERALDRVRGVDDVRNEIVVR